MLQIQQGFPRAAAGFCRRQVNKASRLSTFEAIIELVERMGILIQSALAYPAERAPGGGW